MVCVFPCLEECTGAAQLVLQWNGCLDTFAAHAVVRLNSYRPANAACDSCAQACVACVLSTVSLCMLPAPLACCLLPVGWLQLVCFTRSGVLTLHAKDRVGVSLKQRVCTWGLVVGRGRMPGSCGLSAGCDVVCGSSSNASVFACGGFRCQQTGSVLGCLCDQCVLLTGSPHQLVAGTPAPLRLALDVWFQALLVVCCTARHIVHILMAPLRCSGGAIMTLGAFCLVIYLNMYTCLCLQNLTRCV